MSQLERFSQRLRAQLAAGAPPEDRSPSKADWMAEFEVRHRAFVEVAERVVSEVIRPRLEELASHFPNARLRPANEPDCCVCWFAPCERFPATVRLEFSVDHDEGFEHIWIEKSLRIVPSFFKYEAHARLTMRLDEYESRDQTAIDWVEQEILRFVDTYLRLDRGDEQADEEIVCDPVCQMKFARSEAAARLEYRGHRYFFCSSRCKELFAGEPGRYVRFEVDFD